MATRSKRTERKTKSTRAKTRTKPRKKALTRAASGKKKKTAKKLAPGRSRRTPPLARRQAQRPRRPAKPVIEDTIVDVIDEPLPGVTRITEIEEVSVAMPDDGEQ
jgi:hypothetical protein